MRFYHWCIIALLVFPKLAVAQKDTLGTAFSVGYGFRFTNETTGMHLSLGYSFQYPIGQKGMMGGIKTFASYSGIPERIEVHSETPEGFPYYSRQEGQYYIINLGLVKSFGYNYNFLDIGLDAQLWQFRGIYEEKYDNKHWRYDRMQVDRYLGALLGYSHKRLNGLGFSIFWNPQIAFLDNRRTSLRKENFVLEISLAF